MYTQNLYIDGDWVEGIDTFPVTDPWTGGTVGTAARASSAQVADAIAAAARATTLPLHKRASILRSVATDIEDRREEFARVIRQEAGKPITAARQEVGRAIDTLLLSAEGARGLAGVTVPMDAVSSGEGLVAFTDPHPRGPIAAITPFNFPLNLVAHKVGPAIAAGCPIVLKPSEKTPLTAGLLVDAFHKAGLPAGHLNLVTGDPAEIAEAVLADDRIAVITFTGSAALGWSLKSRSPRKHHVLELGSNTAMVVADDADVEKAVSAAVAAAFTFAGQACVSLQRIYVQEGAADDFISRLAKAAEGLPAGDPDRDETVVGPLITPQATIRIEQWIADAVAAGATVAAGGRMEDGVLRPTVLRDVPSSQKLMCEEAFGPVVSVNTVGTLDEAVAAVNDSRYGLNAAIYTKDIDAALAFSKAVEVGSVLINVPASFRADHMPYGGVKESGQGREGVPYAIRELTEPRLTVLGM
jgi:acyl-CoA reductase-like NAD-dependent aldehyde dehydrogenase